MLVVTIDVHGRDVFAMLYGCRSPYLCRSLRGSPALPHLPAMRAAPSPIDDADTRNLALRGFAIFHTLENTHKFFTSHVWCHLCFDVPKRKTCIAFGIPTMKSKRCDSTLADHQEHQHAVRCAPTIFLKETSEIIVTMKCTLDLHACSVTHFFRTASPARCAPC